MMQGPDAAKEFVNDYLKQDLPGRLIKYRNHWNAHDQLPDPKGYAKEEPTVINATPFIVTMINSTKSIRRGDYDGKLNPQYEVRYNARTYVWVINKKQSTCTQIRDRYITVLRTALLDHPCLVHFANSQNTETKVDESTMVEQFSTTDPGPKADGYICAGYVEYDITLWETVSRDLLGTVDDISIGHILFSES